jgi:acyl-CoA thioester hydrolase
VRYAETDQMGVVHHASYYVWMEAARVEFCRALGFRYRDLETDHGILMAVVETHCRYASAARFDDEVVIESRITRANAKIVCFGYEMSVDGRQIATGETRHIFLNRQLRPTRVPAEFRGLFGLPPQY